MGTNVLDIQICDTVAEAPDYKKPSPTGETYIGASLQKAVIVRHGTEGDNDTVDLQFVDQHGHRFVAIITARLLKTVTDLCHVR